jgi:16S rRNA (guanine966-N2)-methyltransferase
VKEAMFNALHSLGAIEGATVLDLFAGSGALGIEALSRGATHATFVDRSREAVEAVRANLVRTGLEMRSKVVRADASGVISGWTGPPVDLALLDPPYDHDGWDALLGSIPARVVVVESDHLVAIPDRFQLQRDRRYGSTVVQIAELRESTL